MGRPLKWTVERKLLLVLSVLRGEGSVAETDRRHQVSDVTLAKWRDAFLAGGAEALANCSRHGQSGREPELGLSVVSNRVCATCGSKHQGLFRQAKLATADRPQSPSRG